MKRFYYTEKNQPMGGKTSVAQYTRLKKENWRKLASISIILEVSEAQLVRFLMFLLRISRYRKNSGNSARLGQSNFNYF